MNHQNNIISIKCAFKIFFLSALFVVPSFKANAFEFEDYEKKIKTNYNVRNAIEKMPRKDFESILRDFISNSRPGRVMESPGHKKAQEYLENKLKSFSSHGASFSKIEFTGSMEDKKDVLGLNLVWEKKGAVNPDDILIITANYDTLLKDPKTGKIVLKGEMPGADNNATGVAIMLSMIEILDKLDIPKTIRFVFLDFEEFSSQGSKNYIGSADFLNSIKGKKVAGVMNLTMLGHDSRKDDKEGKMNNMKLYTRPKSLEGVALDEAFAKFITDNGKKNYDTVTFAITESPLEAGPFPMTSAAFYSLGIPAITLTQNREGDLNPRFMTSNDFVETLNFNTYTNVFKYVTSAVLDWNYDIVK